jgi:ATP-dependent exoDNAse (exonuclease V) beta subunit
VARDQAEGVRLAYVAATRARDLLVVPALGDEPWEGGWISPLNRALYPPVGARRDATRAPRCPSFKSKDSVLQRPGDETAGPATMCPGLHAFRAEGGDSPAEGGYSVVWWDPSALTLGATPPFGVRREELIVKDVTRNVVADGRGRYDRWHLARDDARAAGAVPSVRTDAARAWTAGDGDDPAALARLAVQPDSIRIVSAGARNDRGRPHGAAFGALVHAVLARAPFDASPSALDDIAQVEARLLGMSSVTAAASTAVVTRVLEHDLLKRARAAAARGRCRRETPVSYMLPDGLLLEGIVDLAFEDDGGWIAVDYKTDIELASLGEDRYRRQVALYASAVARATGIPCAGILLVI